MVQFRPSDYRSNYSSVDFSNDHYWKLDKADELPVHDVEDALIAAGLDSPLSLRRTRRNYLFTRAQRGLIIYEKCTKDELRAFCRARGITIITHSSNDFLKLRNALERYDEAAVFKKFLELPSELRVRIYEQHIWSFDYGDFSSPPPIANTSKTVRHETLAVFFKQRLFMCSDESNHFVWDGNDHVRQRSLQLMPMIANFWQNAPLAFLRSVQRLELMSPIGEGGTGYSEWSIDIGGRFREERVVFNDFGTYSWPRNSQALPRLVEIVKGRLTDVIDGVVAREQAAFERGDAAAILAALTAS